MAEPGDRSSSSSSSSLSSIGTDVTIAVLIVLILASLIGTYFSSLIDWYNGIIAWYSSQAFQTFYTIIVIIFALLDAALIGFIIFTLRRHLKLPELLPYDQELATRPVIPTQNIVLENWNDIKKLADSPNASDWNMAIIRADGLVDETLERLGYQGETVAERLKTVDPSKLPSLDRLWSAHRLRNTIVHELAVDHTKETIAYALESYEQAFHELGMLEEIQKK